MNPITTTFRVDDADCDLARLLFIDAHHRLGHQHVVRRELKRAVAGSDLPARARDVRTLDLVHCTHVVAQVDDALVHVESWKTSAKVTVSATDAAAALPVLEELRGTLSARPARDRIDVTFTDRDSGYRYLEIDVRAWQAVRENYPTEVRRSLDELAAHQPEEEAARRLLLWHGEPGTGKTTAIRALLDAWREWADGVIVTDPERLLTEGKYLRQTVLDHQDADRWQVIILEDAETLLHKGTAGRGMATLLNLCDGLLGQGLRCLFLITTNEPLDRVHPALVRAGRCLSRIEFGKLPAHQASELLGRPVLTPMSLAEALAAKPLRAELAPVPVGQYL